MRPLFLPMPRLIPIEVLEEHFADHFLAAQDYVSSLNAKNGTSLYVNESVLYIAIKSAYDDIERYKLYHLERPDEQKSNAVKRVAYLTKWLMKTRPIHSTAEDSSRNIIPILSNAGLCLSLARAHISSELSKSFAFTLQKEYELIYDLTYREMSGDSLLAIFQNFYDLVRGVELLECLEYKEFHKSP